MSRSAPIVPLIQQKDSLADQALEHLKAAIIAGDLEPDTLYTVNQFATLLGVSRTPVREALLRLVQQRLLIVDRNRGFRVPMITRADLDEIVDLRLMLETPAMGKVAAMRPQPTAALAAARAIFPALEGSAEESSLLEFLSQDRAFHLTLIDALGNRRLTTMIGQLRDQMHLPGLRRMANSGTLKAAHVEHLALLEAIERGDSREAERINATHLERIRREWF